jgi:valine--pyruvate aminotransferase
MERSVIGERLASPSGILELMDDLGEALASNPSMRMMGGGNPASIPEVDAVWRRRVEEVMREPGGLERVLVNYDPPAGSPAFREALAGLLRRSFGWDLTAANVAVTAGGQAAFFYLFNLLAGPMPGGGSRKILLPLVPEYIGYANQGAASDLFTACRPRVETSPDRTFKYRIDFDAVEARLTGEVAAVCVSRPTNPTGNVLTDDEMRQLSDLCRRRGKLLVIDNAYGAPFPDIIFTGAKPLWDDHIVLTLSLSKLGLPGTRTGIVIARPEIARDIAAMTSVVGLANGNVGQAIVRPLVESGEILRLSKEVIQPFYRERSAHAQRAFFEAFPSTSPARVHRSEGALFLWLWFEGLPVTTRTLYERLKQRDVLVVPGNYFFFGLPTPWAQEHECVRVTFSQDPKTVQEGIGIIADEVAKAYRGGTA